MKRAFVISLFLMFVGAMSSCAMFGDSPDKVFQTIALNSNKIPRDFQRHFKEIRQQRAADNLVVYDQETKATRKASASEFVEYHYARMFEQDIEKVSALKDTEEVKPIKEAALEMFRYADAIYKTDFPKIAKMLDDGASDAEIDAAVEELESTKGVELHALYERVMKDVIPYADKHGVEYKTIEMP